MLKHEYGLSKKSPVVQNTLIFLKERNNNYKDNELSTKEMSNCLNYQSIIIVIH